MLIILVVSSTLSFTLNVYNFLFVKRLAIYFWFAVLPLLWIALPLAVAAWVTDTCQTFAGVVLQNWAQSSGDAAHTSLQGMTNDVTPEVTCITCRSSSRSKKSLCENSIGNQYARPKFRKNLRNVIRPLQVKSSPKESNTNAAYYIGAENMQNSFSPKLTGGETLKPTVEQRETDQRVLQAAIDWGTGLEPAVGEQPIGQQALGRVPIISCNYSQIVPAVRFDFERYIIYLQCLLPDVGFSVAGCLVTWEKLFGLAVFMISVAAVFIQEVIFGSGKNTIAARP